MNLLDILIAATMGFLILKGMLRGIIREVASLVGVILGIWLGSKFQPQMTGYLKSNLPATQLVSLISFAALFAVVLSLCNLSGWVLRLLLGKTFFGWADKSFGAGLATLKGIILVYLVMVILTFSLPAKTPLIANSRLAPKIIFSYQAMVRLISPDHLRNWKKKIVGKKEQVGEIVSDKIEELAKQDG